MRRTGINLGIAVTFTLIGLYDLARGWVGGVIGCLLSVGLTLAILWRDRAR